MKITIVEHVGDTNNWEWYEIYRNLSPRMAIQRYLLDMFGKKEKTKLKIDGNGYKWYHAGYSDVRAMEYDI